MNTTNKFTVVIPMHNKVHEIVRCLMAVMNNEVVPDEIIVVDNNSTDGSRELIERLNSEGKFKNAKSFRIVEEKKQGAGAARNRGLSEARSEYIILLDADDYWEPNFLVRLDNLISQNKSNVYVLGYRHFYGNSKCLRNRNIKKGVSSIVSRETFFFNYFWNRGFICSSNLVISRSVVKQFHFPSGSYEEDLQLWFNLAGNEILTFDPKSYVVIDKKPKSKNSSVLQNQLNSKIAQDVNCGFWERQCRYRRSIYLCSYLQLPKLIISHPKYLFTVTLEMIRRAMLSFR